MKTFSPSIKFIFTLLLFCCMPLAAQNGKQAGTIEFSRGLTTAQHGDQAPRIVGKDGVFYENEVLSTADKSFAVIRLQDNSRMTLRPNTQFAVEQINASNNRSDSAVLHLFKGGLRAVTGFISKVSTQNKQANYQVKTPVATIGIRGTEFDARICEQDCPQSSANTGGPAAAAKLAFIQGTIIARDAQGDNRTLKSGDAIYEGDTLSTAANSHAVLAFPDNSRISLQPETLFRVERFRFTQTAKEDDGALFNLIKGGLRAITGLLGKTNPEAYRVQTPVATIGIRGTGFDLQCQGKCVDRFYTSQSGMLQQMLDFLISPAHAQTPQGSGLFAHVWAGTVELQLSGRMVLLNENQIAFLSNDSMQPLILSELPPLMRNNPAPRPDKVDIKLEEFFSGPGKAKPGLYVSVDQGQVTVDDVRVNPGEAVFSSSDSKLTIKLDGIPEFMLQDPFPKPGQFNQAMYRLLRTLDSGQDAFECEMQ